MEKIFSFCKKIVKSKIAMLTIFAAAVAMGLSKNISVIFSMIVCSCIVFGVTSRIISNANKLGALIPPLIVLGIIIFTSAFAVIKTVPALPYIYGDAYKIESKDDFKYCKKHGIHNVSIFIDDAQDTGYESVLIRNGVAVGTEYRYAIVQTSAGKAILRYYENFPKINTRIDVYLDSFSQVDEQLYQKLSDRGLMTVNGGKNKVILIYTKYGDEKNLEKGNTCLFVYWIILACFIAYDGIKRFENRTGITVKGRKKSHTAQTSEKSAMQTMADDIFEALESKGLSKYLLMDFTTSVAFSYRDLGSKEKTREKLYLLFYEILKYFNLPPFIELNIDYENEDSPNTAGEYRRRGDKKTITLHIKEESGPNQIVATLCHESTHYFMEYRGLNWEDADLNEIRTDVMANLIGFNRILIDGYEKKVDVQTNGYTQTTKTSTVGYITAKDCMELRNILKEQRDLIKVKEAMDFRKKQSIEELRKLLDTAKVLSQQLCVLDPRGNKDGDSRTKSQIDNISQAVYEYDIRDIDKEVSNLNAILDSDPDNATIENAILSANRLCTEMLRWSAAFQGKIFR